MKDPQLLNNENEDGSADAATTSQYQNQKQPLRRRRRRSYQDESAKHAKHAKHAAQSQWISDAIFSYGVSVFAIIPGLLKVVESQTYGRLLGTPGAKKVKSFVTTLSDKLTYMTAGQLKNHVEKEESQKEKRDAMLSDIRETLTEAQDKFKELQTAQEGRWFNGRVVARSIKKNIKDIDKLRTLITNSTGLSLPTLGLILGGLTVFLKLFPKIKKSLINFWAEMKLKQGMRCAKERKEGGPPPEEKLENEQKPFLEEEREKTDAQKELDDKRNTIDDYIAIARRMIPDLKNLREEELVSILGQRPQQATNELLLRDFVDQANARMKTGQEAADLARKIKSERTVEQETRTGEQIAEDIREKIARKIKSERTVEEETRTGEQIAEDIRKKMWQRALANNAKVRKEQEQLKILSSHCPRGEGIKTQAASLQRYFPFLASYMNG